MFSNSVIILASFVVVKSSKILVVAPTPSVSHQVVFRPLIQELINRDHDVTVITTDPLYPQGEIPDNLREINVHDISYKLRLKLFSNRFLGVDQNNFSKMQNIITNIIEMFMEQLKDESIHKFLKDTTVKFDLLVIASFIPATLIFSHIYKTPVIFMSTFGPLPGNMNVIGLESHPLLYPVHYHEKSYNLTIWDKMCELYYEKVYSDMHENQELDFDRLLRRMFGTDTPSLNKLKSNVHMLFLNTHPIWSHNQPVTHNVAYTWGIVQQPEKMLPEDLQEYLDSSKHGVIYMSFGSLLRTSEMSPEILKIFVGVFSRLPYDILWKWDSDELPGKSENIKISKWFPQCDVLRHPNIKLFITHGGLQSTTEAIQAGVPVIGIPQFSDQIYNAEKYEHFKIGLKLDYKLLTIENFERAINTFLINYNSYKENIIRLRTLMYDQPKPALENAIWWIEYILRHGGVRHLRAPAANMSWTEYYELEIVILVISALIVFGGLLLVMMYICLVYILRLINIKSKKLKTSIKNKLK